MFLLSIHRAEFGKSAFHEIMLKREMTPFGHISGYHINSSEASGHPVVSHQFTLCSLAEIKLIKASSMAGLLFLVFRTLFFLTNIVFFTLLSLSNAFLREYCCIYYRLLVVANSKSRNRRDLQSVTFSYEILVFLLKKTFSSRPGTL